MQLNKLMKMTAAIVSSSFLLTQVSHAATPGAYAGIGAGVSQLNTGNINSLYVVNSDDPYTTTTSTTNRGVAGKLFAGYNFNPYLGLEASYAAYARSFQRVTYTNTVTQDSSLGTVQRQVQAVSLVGKAYLPLEAFNVYALAGGAEVFNKMTVTPAASQLAFLSSNGSATVHSLRPVYGIGASYTIDSHVNAGFEVSRIQGKGNIKTSARAIPTANMLTFNIAYQLG